MKKCIWSETGTKNGVDYSYAQYFEYNDGGRKESGFKGSTGDCVIRAISIVTGLNYKNVYNDLFKLSGESPRTGVKRKYYDKYLKGLGFTWIPLVKIGTGCTVHLTGRELPKGKLICRLSKHLTSVIDGVINDMYDYSRQGTRCVYGYYIKN